MGSGQYSQNNKLELAKQLGIDCMIEDSVEFINEVSKFCPVYYPIAGYNKDMDVENAYGFETFLALEDLI